MKREEIKNILGEGAADEVVTKLLDALHAEIEPHKTAAKTAQDALAAKVAEIDELSKKTTDADELKKQLNDLVFIFKSSAQKQHNSTVLDAPQTEKALEIKSFSR